MSSYPFRTSAKDFADAIAWLGLFFRQSSADLHLAVVVADLPKLQLTADRVKKQYKFMVVVAAAGQALCEQLKYWEARASEEFGGR